MADEQVSLSEKIKLFRNLQTLHQSLASNAANVEIPPWGTGFAYYIIFVIALANIVIYVDVWVKNPNVILGVHLTRIILLLSILILAIVSFAKGWRGTPISINIHIIVKLLSFAITLGYLISMAVKVSHTKTPKEIFRLVLSALLTVVSAILTIMAIINKFSEDTVPIKMYQIIIISVIAITMSISSILMRNSENEPESTTEPVAGPAAEPPATKPPATKPITGLRV